MPSLLKHGISDSIFYGMEETEMKNNSVKKLAEAGLMAALCFAGYMVFPAISASGTKVHVGNAFVVLGALLLGGVWGGLSGAVGLTLADIISGYAASAPRTFITKLVIGLIVGLVAHRLCSIDLKHEKKEIFRISVLASAAGLLFNCVFEPALKYVWYTLLTPNADKAASAIKALLAVTTYSTLINAVINTVIAVILYNVARPVLKKSNLL